MAMDFRKTDLLQVLQCGTQANCLRHIGTDGNLTDARTREELAALLTAFAAWIARGR